MGQAGFRRARHRLFRQDRIARALCRYQPGQFPEHDGHFGLFLHRHRAARRKDDERRRLDADAYLLWRRAGDAALQRDGRRQGRSRGQRDVSGRGSGQGRHPRQRDQRRSDQDACRQRHRRFPLYPEMERAELAAAAQRDHRGCGQIRALPAQRSGQRHHRRSPACRRGLSCRRHEGGGRARYRQDLTPARVGLPLTVPACGSRRPLPQDTKDHPMTDRLPHEKGFHVSWDQLHRDARALAWRLQDVAPAGGEWRAVIAITRGGMAPAMIVARELDIRTVDTISVKSYHAGGGKADHQREAEVLKSPDKTMMGDGEGVLIVDDLVDTGKTLELVRLLYPKAHFATVYAKPKGEPMVDTFITGVSQDTWIFFPWDMALQYVEPYRGTE